ncbi:MAG TPA: glutamine synthetase family protein [Candidatus Micrarchaeia archaeon]|nr:glutamine synthetase family protein [Candidatus Micrarchaeia archaeon]
MSGTDRAAQSRPIGGGANAAALSARLIREGVDGVVLHTVDNSGIGRVKTIPVARLEHAARHGVGISPVFDTFLFDDSSTVSPHAGGPVGDLRLVPDLRRLVRLAAQPGWAWAPADRLTQAGEPWPICQRHFAHRQAERARALGLALRMSFEVEWVVGADDGRAFVPACGGAAYGADRLVPMADYGRDLVRALVAEAVGVEQFHPEYAPGQFEVSVAPQDPVGAADRTLLVRQTIAAVTYRHGWRCSFAPVVEPDGVGNGAHLHLSAWRDGRNCFAGGPGPHGLTAEGAAFVAGVLDALPALLAVGAPSVASYLRLVPQRWSGPFRCWGLENREAGIRLIRGLAGTEGWAANAEVKCFDATANPYLVVGAVVAAGLDGIERGLSLPPEVTVDPSTLAAGSDGGAAVERLPGSLGQALAHFRRSPVLAEAMGAPLFETFASVREAELARLAGLGDAELATAVRWRS